MLYVRHKNAMSLPMIQSFRSSRTEALFRGDGGDRRWRSFEKVARRKLLMLDGAHALFDLASPPANRLEALKGDPARAALDPDQ